MKKTILSLSIVAVAGIAILVSCNKKDEGPDCTAMAKSVENAVSAYAADQSSQNCTALKDAYRDYLNSTCVPESERASVQQALDALEMFCQ